MAMRSCRPEVTDLLANRRLRVAATTLVAILAGAGSVAQAKPRRPPVPVVARTEPVAVIDLRSDSADRAATRASLIESLAGINGLSPLRDPELDAALAGESPTQVAADQALERAQTAYGAIDCVATTAAALAAIDGYAALQAAGDPVGDGLRRGYVYLLLCANGRGDIDAAQRAATRLRRLTGDAAPTGVNPTIWSRYPPIDAASNVAMVELSITTTPTGAEVWVDHEHLGPAPQTVVVTVGDHIVAAATAEGSTSRHVDVGASSTVTVDIADTAGRWEPVRRLVASWRSGAITPDAIALAALLDQIKVRFAIVVAGKEQAEVWARPTAGQPARRITTNRVTASFEMGAAIVEQVNAWEGPQDLVATGDPNIQYLEPRPKSQKWWVYAGILGAVAIGTGLILANDLADDHQRIELTWP